jgi:hypothetical protein
MLEQPPERAGDRRQRILDLLAAADLAVTGNELAQRLGVSRQIIVQDVAVLRAGGAGILATPQGYLLASHLQPAAHRLVIACRHDRAQVEEELQLLVDCGVTVIDVIVEHPVYGELRAPLWLRSRLDVAEFMQKLRATQASLLSSLTGGVHLHTIEASRPEPLQLARQRLAAATYLIDDDDA